MFHFNPADNHADNPAHRYCIPIKNVLTKQTNCTNPTDLLSCHQYSKVISLGEINLSGQIYETDPYLKCLFSNCMSMYCRYIFETVNHV